MMFPPCVLNNVIYNGDGVCEISRNGWFLTKNFQRGSLNLRYTDVVGCVLAL